MADPFLSQASVGVQLSAEQKFDWLRLIRSENIGPRSFQKLIARYGSAGAALEALPALIARGTMARAVVLADKDSVARELERADRLGVAFIGLGEPDYPPLLRLIDAPPPLVAVKGDCAVLQRPMVALVGSRNASGAGMVFAERMAQALGDQGYVIVSGLARGIDQAAHVASLIGGTVAVLAGGHEKPYPSENVPLLDKIMESGAAISEMPLAWEPRGRDFPRRNRIIAGLSYGTVVVEAARKSGTLVTARFAREQGREVFAVPGSPLDPRTEGTNDLLRQGATLCTKPEDVLEAIAPMLESRGQFVPRLDMFRNSGDDAEPFAGEDEPLWQEADIFGDGAADTAPAPRVNTAFAFDEAARRYRGYEEPQATLAYEGDERQAPFAATVTKRAGMRLAHIIRAEAVKPDIARATVVGLLGPSPLGVDELSRLANMPVSVVQGVLFDLDLEGRLERHGAGLVSLRVGEG